jgi:hypothetical protein
MMDAQQPTQTVSSVLMSSAAARLGGALAIVAMLWLGVAWALK